MKNFISINPYSEEQLAFFDFITNEELEKCLQKANENQSNWQESTFSEKAKKVIQLGELLAQNAEKLAVLASTEMGKIQSEAKAEVLKSVRLCEFYASRSADILQSKISQSETGASVEVKYEPLGIVLGIFPWNFPFWQILRSAIPAIMSGNCMLIKPAPNVPLCSLALQDIFNQCGLGEGVLQTIFASEKQIEALIEDNRIAATTLTGSEKAGAAIASISGKNIKKSVLELGGSDPFIVLADADLTLCVAKALEARFQNNGQSCVSAKRFIVHESIAQNFLASLIQKINSLALGDPTNQKTSIGPLARKDLKEQLEEQVNIALKAGAKILYQHQNKPEKGFFFPPTVIGKMPNNQWAYEQEFFGPVICFYTFNEVSEAIEMANNTQFGLGASIWSKDILLAKQMASKIKSGMVYVNQIVKSDARFPFGGVKKSGFGRELGEFGLREFCNIKTIWV